MSSNRTRIGRTLLAALAAALLALPGAAAADSGEIGIVLEKSVEGGTLTLEGGTVLQVTSATVITGLNGRRITLEDVPAAVNIGEGYEVDGDETIRYEAVRRGSKRIASSIQLLGVALD